MIPEGSVPKTDHQLIYELRCERDALQAKLTKIGGLLDYWGNSGKEDYCGKLFRAIEEELEK
jgi:hypothetical protein